MASSEPSATDNDQPESTTPTQSRPSTERMIELARQYTLLERLGTGSFATVYKALRNDTKEIVAIKIISR
jgi:serine/threonine protein kinase